MANPGPMPAPGGALAAVPPARTEAPGFRWRVAVWLYALVAALMVIVVRPSGEPYVVVTGLVLATVGLVIGLVAVARSAPGMRGVPAVGTVLAVVPSALAALI